MKDTYKIPAKASIGHVHLKVADIQRSLDFYIDLLGFELKAMMGTDAAFIAAGGYHHHIGLNTWRSKGMPPASTTGVGLFHLAIVYPTRKDLAFICKRLSDHEYPISGAADHGVSESLYLEDPDGNSIELYCDRPSEEWKYEPDGTVTMYTARLDIEGLLHELD
ncbi:MAG: VOC family protein [Pricia sp.]